MAAKITMDMIKPFTGEGDVVSWLKKVTLVAKLQKITDLASFIPLYLEDAALALYLEQSDEEQESAEKIKEKLTVAFTDDAFSAFAKLVQLKWTGESVDVYSNEIRRLAGLAKFDKTGLENVVKLAFVNGFPDAISVALQQVPDVLTMDMSKLIDHARILASKQQGGTLAAVTIKKGGEIKCKGADWVRLRVNGEYVTVRAVASDRLVEGVDVVLGVDVIDQLGGVAVAQGKVCFGALGVASVCQESVSRESEHKLNEGCGGSSSNVVIEDSDFHAVFDGQKWTVKWFWKNGRPLTLTNKISCYDKKLEGRKKEEFEKEIDRWITEGILIPWKEEVNTGVIPLMAVEQATKNKVRPVLDFRELNSNVMCHTGDDVIDVCSETLREWRQTGENASLVDLKSAYLQLGVDEELWPYQLVNYKGRTFCLTSLGFGLNSAPRIMSKILKTVLSKDEKVRRATKSYVDDIIVNESVASVEEVIRHLNVYGLITKSPESLDGGAALGLRLSRVAGELMFQRGNTVPEVSDMLTRRELFSICGKLVGHYPIAGWLRVACSFIKRSAAGARWEGHIGEKSMMMIKDVIERVQLDDPVRGNWCVPGVKHGVVWCDASKIALGVVLEIDRKIVEDAAWLRKKDDFNHINVAELEAVLKGINMAIKWGLTSMELRTDSATVEIWVNTVLSAEKRVHTKGAAEMLIKRRLGNLKELISEFGLKVVVQFVPTEKNKADIMTRVKKSWLVNTEVEDAHFCASVAVDLTELHHKHHMGIDRTLYLARKMDPEVSRESVKRVVQCCDRCQSIDPAPVIHTRGEVSVESNWQRLAIDVTHYRQVPYLSVVDCGPGRFAIWRKLKRENAQEISAELESIFLERGPVNELLLDNSTAFRSQYLGDMLGRWKISRVFRAAYRPGGNGIVERHHRTIKAIAERGGISPIEAVYWYNSTPRSGPQQSVYRYEWRYPSLVPRGAEASQNNALSIKMGEEVWVKPRDARCTTRWCKGIVTDVNSENNISVDGMPRHVLDVRPVVVEDSPGEVLDSDSSLKDSVVLASDQEVTRNVRPRRNAGPPAWMADYVCD
ncbi:hypothetical protein Pmani_010884 [Petrolisthes manimaculis]|uniref:Integrase catalytic domain-containing protein n=2 Tax=Petrolisthes manimaculis TaxID=1843537 RepID=A0AAE1Q1S7_9EUCA|nr:hypothetical protein Pmani_010884 [Petrolisthes manimaculis]